jgi:hypothetical protein
MPNRMNGIFARRKAQQAPASRHASPSPFHTPWVTAQDSRCGTARIANRTMIAVVRRLAPPLTIDRSAGRFGRGGAGRTGSGAVRTYLMPRPAGRAR